MADLSQPKPKKATYDFARDETFPKDHRVVDFAGLRWSDDGQTLSFGIKSWENKPVPKAKKDEKKPDEPKKDQPKKDEPKKPAAKKSLRDTLKEPAGVEVWHAKDVDIMPLQKKRVAQKKRENFLAAWWLDDGKLVPLGNDLTEGVVLLEGQKHALGLDNTPYEHEKKFGPTVHDVYLIDVKTGDRKKVLDHLKFTLGSSPDGRYVLYVKDKNVWSYDLKAGTHVNLTGGLGVSFINEELSTLTDEKPPYGVGTWTKDGSHVLLYDRYDAWLLKPDGKDPRRLTDGRKDKVIHRRIRLDFEGDGDRYLRLDQPHVPGDQRRDQQVLRLCPAQARREAGDAHLEAQGDPAPAEGERRRCLCVRRGRLRRFSRHLRRRGRPRLAAPGIADQPVPEGFPLGSLGAG